MSDPILTEEERQFVERFHPRCSQMTISAEELHDLYAIITRLSKEVERLRRGSEVKNFIANRNASTSVANAQEADTLRQEIERLRAERAPNICGIHNMSTTDLTNPEPNCMWCDEVERLRQQRVELARIVEDLALFKEGGCCGYASGHSQNCPLIKARTYLNNEPTQESGDE